METQTTTGKLTATRRTETGKGNAHKLRAKGLIPGICYGLNQETIPITFNPTELRKALDPAKRRNTLIELTIQGEGQSESIQVMLKDYQLEPLKQTILHADFIRVADDTIIEVAIPLILEGKPEGVKLGGSLHQVFRTLPIRCKPAQIPDAIKADVSALELNQAIRVENLTILGQGIEVMLPTNQTVALVIPPKKEKAATEEVPAEGEAVEGAPADGEKAAAATGAKEEKKEEKKEKKEKGK
jgi:large subunit ribosomal protein L25